MQRAGAEGSGFWGSGLHFSRSCVFKMRDQSVISGFWIKSSEVNVHRRK